MRRNNKHNLQVLLLLWIVIFMNGCATSTDTSSPLELKFSSRSYTFDIAVLFKQLNWNVYPIVADKLAWSAIPNVVDNVIINHSHGNSTLFIVYDMSENDFSYVIIYITDSPFDMKMAICHNNVYTEVYNMQSDTNNVTIGNIEKITIKGSHSFLLTESETIRYGNVSEKGGRTFLVKISRIGNTFSCDFKQLSGEIL